VCACNPGVRAKVCRCWFGSKAKMLVGVKTASHEYMVGTPAASGTSHSLAPCMVYKLSSNNTKTHGQYCLSYALPLCAITI